MTAPRFPAVIFGGGKWKNAGVIELWGNPGAAAAGVGPALPHTPVVSGSRGNVAGQTSGSEEKCCSPYL